MRDGDIADAFGTIVPAYGKAAVVLLKETPQSSAMGAMWAKPVNGTLIDTH